MPANIVKTAEQERLWKKAKNQAEKQGRGKDYAYIMGIYKRMSGLEKSLGKSASFNSKAEVRVKCSMVGACTLEKLLNKLRVHGNPGHSFAVIVDPDMTEKEGKETLFWDGDGSDSIQAVTVQSLDKAYEYSNGKFKKVVTKKEPMTKSHYVPANFRHFKIDGQIPRSDAAVAKQLAETPPKPLTMSRLLAQDSPRLTVKSIVNDLGFTVQKADEWSKFLRKTISTVQNEIGMRQQIMEKCLESGMDTVLRNVILQRSVQYWRDNMQKAVQIYTVDELRKALSLDHKKKRDPKKYDQKELAMGTKEELEHTADKVRAAEIAMDHLDEDPKYYTKLKTTFSKAEARGGKYHRRVPNSNGKGYRYIYDEKTYSKREDAHLEGPSTSKVFMGKLIEKCIGGFAEKGCDVSELKALVKRFGAKSVSASLRERIKNGQLSFKKGKFYAR